MSKGPKLDINGSKETGGFWEKKKKKKHAIFWIGAGEGLKSSVEDRTEQQDEAKGGGKRWEGVATNRKDNCHFLSRVLFYTPGQKERGERRGAIGGGKNKDGGV